MTIHIRALRPQPTPLIRMLMVLGGHASVLIDENVDPGCVAQVAAAAKFRIAGQLCITPSRFLVHRRIYEEFAREFARRADAIKVADDFTDGAQMAPVANDGRSSAVASLVEDATRRGAKIAAGGRRNGNRSYFYAPTALSDVPRDSEVMRVEPYGPPAACSPVEDMDEALSIAELLVELANYVVTNSPERADRLAAELRSSPVAVNSFKSPGAHAPFGGYKEIGYGRKGGGELLDSYFSIKTISRSKTRS